MRTRFSSLLTTGLATLFLLTAGAVTSSAGTRVYVRVAPPRAVVDVRAGAPGPGYAWVAGYHRWDGRAYAWVPGAWHRPPRAGVVWVPGHWAHNRHGWYFVEGHWR